MSISLKFSCNSKVISFSKTLLQMNYKNLEEEQDLYISKSNQKPDLRKKKQSLFVNFREDLNVEAQNTVLKTPQGDTR